MITLLKDKQKVIVTTIPPEEKKETRNKDINCDSIRIEQVTKANGVIIIKNENCLFCFNSEFLKHFNCDEFGKVERGNGESSHFLEKEKIKNYSIEEFLVQDMNQNSINSFRTFFELKGIGYKEQIMIMKLLDKFNGNFNF